MTGSWRTFLSKINHTKTFCISWGEDKVLNLFPQTAVLPSSSSVRCFYRAQNSRWKHWQAVCRDQRPLVQSVLGDQRFSLKLGHWQVQSSIISLKVRTFCAQLFKNCFSKEWGQWKYEVTALGWIDAIKRIPEGLRLRVRKFSTLFLIWNEKH